MKNCLLFLVMQSVLLMSVYAAPVCSKASPAFSTAMLELYTSEGCSSCPPADNLVRQLYQSTGLSSDQVIALAFHVDYWDYIGWKDPYAQPVHAARQNYLSSLVGSKTIYTPEFFLDGKEFRIANGSLKDAVTAINRRPALANIRIQLEPVRDNKITVQLEVDSQQAGELNYFLVEQQLTSKVHAGENSGATLKHDAVARFDGTAVAVAANHASKHMVQLAVPADSVVNNLSIVAFVQNRQGLMLQALSVPLCR